MEQIELKKIVEESCVGLTPQLSRLWPSVHVPFKKWELSPWADDEDGFWVVALIGQEALYYNSIEDGFNWTPYSEYGLLEHYRCDQDELQHALIRLTKRLSGEADRPVLGPPETLLP